MQLLRRPAIIFGRLWLLICAARCAQDLCRLNNFERADEIDLYEWSPGGMIDWDNIDDDDVPMYSGPLPGRSPAPHHLPSRYGTHLSQEPVKCQIL